MAKSTFWGRAKKKIKEWFSGGNNKATPPKPRAVATNRDARNQTVSSRTSAPSFNKRAFVASLNDSKKEKKEENRVQNAYKATKQEYKSVGEELKGSFKKLDSALKKDVPDPKQAAAQKSKERAKKTAKKAGDALYFMATDEERKAIDAVKGWNKANKQQRKEFHERTGNKYNAHTGDKAHDKQAAQLIKGGFNSADPVAEELAIKYHPTAYSATRGAASGTTFGLSELALQRRKGERAELEKYYQENKNRGAELAGELVGSLAGFGGVSKVAEVPAAKIVGSELGEKAVGKLAASRLTRATSKRALKKLGVEASEDLIKNVARRKAEKVATGLATGTLVDATAGNLMNATMASRDYKWGSDEWKKAFWKYAKWNALMGAGVSLAPALVGGKGIAAEEATKLFNQQRRQAVQEGADAVKNYLWAERGVGAGNVPNRGRLFGESLDERIARQDARTNFTREMRGNKGSLVDRANALDEELAGNPIQNGVNIRDLARQQPAAEIADADVLLDEMIENATTVDDFMALGLSRPEAEILAESKAKVVAAEEAAEKIAPPTKRGLPKGNIRSIEETLGANEFLPRNRNAQYVRAPRSAKRVDTSIDGLTKRLEELRSRVPQTDKERRALQTEINEVEDLLNRTKWRKEGGANMDAMRKAYGGEYAGFDMSKSTNSYQSDALEGKIKGKTATIVEMSPDEYMERAYRQIFKKPSGKSAQFAEIPETSEAVAKYAEAMRNGEKFPLPYLDYTNAGQEGRHRALAAKQAGIDRIPVVVIDDAANPKAVIDDIAEATSKTVEPKVAPPMGEREYYVSATYKSGSKKTVKVTAASEEEAIAKAADMNGVESATNARATKPTEEEMDKKVQNILDYIGEGEEPAASGVKPAAETLEPREIPSLRERDYTIEKTFQSGAKRKVAVRATSDAEALDKVYAGKNAKNIKNAKILDSVEATPASEAAAKGTKPAAATLEPKGTKAAPKTDTGFAPKSVDEITAKSGVKHEKVSNKEKVHDFWGSFRTKFVDSLDAFEQANKEFLKSDPERWALNNGAIDKLRRHQGMAVRSISEGQLGWNGQPLKDADGNAAKSLKAIYEGLDGEREKLFETYLLLEHSPYRTAAGKPIYAGEFAEREACEKAAKEILKDNPDFERRANELYQYTRNELQNRVDAGLIPQEVADDWFKKYPKYVPTGRQGEFKPDEDIWEVAHELARNGNTVKPSEIKAAQEAVSDLPIRSIKEQLSEATTRNWRDMSMNNLFKRMFGDKAAAQLAVEADGGLATVLDNTVNLSKTAGKAGKGGKYYAEVFVDGKPQRVEIEKRFYDAIKDLNKNGRVGDAIDFASDVAAKLSTPFKNVVTSWNPIFMVKNGMRDFPEAVINSRNTKEFMECMDAALKDLYGVEGGGMWTTALRNQGVSQANFVNLEEAITKERTLLGKGANKFATLQEAVETYPRLVEFMATIKKLNGGVLPETLDNVPMEWLDIAAANAADVTVNFGRSGSIGKMLNRGFVPFFNPSVQGFDKFVRNLSQQPSTAKLLGTITKALALGTGVTALNNMMLDDNPYYQQIAAREKATNILIACPFKIEDGKVTMVDKDEANVFIKIPKSRFAAAYSIPMVNVANENKMGWAEMFKVAGDQVAPVNPVESNILAPFFLAKKNTTWYGTPIVSASIENKTNPSQEYDANTSLIGKALGKATSKLPTELQISPKKADYILDATTGVFGDFLLPMMTPSRQGGGKNPLAKGGYAAGNVVKRAFSIDANTQNDLSTRFYDSIQVAEDNKKLANSSAEDKEEYNRLSAYSKEVSGLNQAIRHLQDGERGTKQKDIYELQKVRNQLMKDALDGKPVPTSEKMLDAVQEYVGTTYAVESFGSSADKEAMKVYGEAVYGNLSKKEMKARIDSDENFYKGVRAIGGLEDQLDKEGVKSTNVLSKAVALASIDADDDLFGAYKCTKQSRTETADKMTRAREYISNGGSDDEFVQLEKARRTMGKLSDYDKDAELDKIDEQLKNGEIGYEEYYNKQGEIKYNANISRVGLATSLAMANAPERAYRLYDIKDANIQKGINLAAMGYDARGYREMAKAIDTSGNGYLSRQEVVDYVANSGVADKATLFDALYPYQTKYNPFGTPTKYSISQAAEAGRAKGFASIGGANNDFKISDSGKGNGNSYGGYGGYRHYKRYGGGGGGMKISALPKSNYKASKQTYKDIASMLKTTRKSNSTRVANTVKVEPPTVKFKKYEV